MLQVLMTEILVILDLRACGFPEHHGPTVHCPLPLNPADLQALRDFNSANLVPVLQSRPPNFPSEEFLLPAEDCPPANVHPRPNYIEMEK